MLQGTADPLESLLGWGYWLIAAAFVSAQAPADSQNVTDSNCLDPALAGTGACNSQGTMPSSTRASAPYSSESTPSPQIPANYNDADRWSNAGSRPTQAVTPDQLTEFQKFAAAATGQMLPIFGADLFSNVPSTFAPLDLTPVPANYIIGPGDELRIRVWGQVSFEANLRVDRSGEIYIPKIGPVHIAGITFSELPAKLRDAVAPIFHNFQLTVDLGQIRAIQIYVSGHARRPGVYTISALSNLLDALFASGGPSADGTLRRIELRRNGQLLSELDLYILLTAGDKGSDTVLQSGDVLFVPPVGPQVALTGSVHDPRIYELKPGETVKDLLSDAGGTSAVAAESKISIGRVDEHRALQTLAVSFDPNGLSTQLADGDLIYVNSIVPHYEATVTLRGNVANPGKFLWHPGIRVSELIPDRDSLLTRNYWLRRIQLGLPSLEFEADARAATNQNFSRSGVSADEQRRQAQGSSNNSTIAAAQANNRQMAGGGQSGMASITEVKLAAPEIDWKYAVVERLDHNTLRLQLLPFDLGQLVLEHNASQDIELQPDDVVTIFSEADIQLPIDQRTKLIKLQGEFWHAGSYTAGPNETLRDLVMRAGGLTNQAYLYGSEFRRESAREIQQARIDEYVRGVELQIEHSNLATAASAATNQQDLAASTAARGSQQEIVAQLQQLRATGRIVLQFKPGTTGVSDIPDIKLEDGDVFVVPSKPAHVNVIGSVYNQDSFVYKSTTSLGSYLRMSGGPDRNADVSHEFVIRANGEIVGRSQEGNFWPQAFYGLRLNPGDTIVVPEKPFKPSALRGVLDWSQMFSQFAIGAAGISVLR